MLKYQQIYHDYNHNMIRFISFMLKINQMNSLAINLKDKPHDFNIELRLILQVLIYELLGIYALCFVMLFLNLIIYVIFILFIYLYLYVYINICIYV